MDVVPNVGELVDILGCKQGFSQSNIRSLRCFNEACWENGCGDLELRKRCCGHDLSMAVREVAGALILLQVLME